MNWRGLNELLKELGPLAQSFQFFSNAQDAYWAERGESGMQPIAQWLEHRWGSVFVPDGGTPSEREIVVYERTGQYCGAFRYDPDTGAWTDLESGFTHPDPEGQ